MVQAAAQACFERLGWTAMHQVDNPSSDAACNVVGVKAHGGWRLLLLLSGLLRLNHHSPLPRTPARTLAPRSACACLRDFFGS